MQSNVSEQASHLDVSTPQVVSGARSRASRQLIEKSRRLMVDSEAILDRAAKRTNEPSVPNATLQWNR